MKTITQLEQRIATVETLLAENQRRVDAEPGNFAAALQQDSTRHHLADLRRQLQRAKAAHVAPHFGDAAREGGGSLRGHRA